MVFPALLWLRASFWKALTGNTPSVCRAAPCLSCTGLSTWKHSEVGCVVQLLAFILSAIPFVESITEDSKHFRFSFAALRNYPHGLALQKVGLGLKIVLKLQGKGRILPVCPWLPAPAMSFPPEMQGAVPAQCPDVHRQERRLHGKAFTLFLKQSNPQKPLLQRVKAACREVILPPTPHTPKLMILSMCLLLASLHVTFQQCQPAFTLSRHTEWAVWHDTATLRTAEVQNNNSLGLSHQTWMLSRGIAARCSTLVFERL